MQQRKFKQIAPSALCGAIAAAFAASASAWVSPLDDRYVGGALNLCDFGSFFVGGVPKVTNYANSAVNAGPPEDIIIGQMYVQFFIPKKRRTWPLVIMHGSGYSGSCVESTPDGREGWVPYAVRNNIAVFNVDQPGRARSGFDRSRIHEARVTGDLSLVPTLGGGSSVTIWTQWFGHLIPAGSTIMDGTLIRHGDDGDPDPAEDFSNPSEAHGDYPPAYPIPPVPNSIDPNIAARVGAIGPAPNPANWDYLALESYKYLVPNTEVTLPGSTCAACTPTTLSGQVTWGPRAMAELVERLGGAVISGHSQGGGPMLHTARILKEHGKLDLLKGILIPESAGISLPATGLVGSDFDNVPFLVLQGDYRPLATRIANQVAVDAMNASPTSNAKHESVHSETLGFQGVTHMMMLGTSNLEVFDFMLNWASENIDNPPSPTKCP